MPEFTAASYFDRFVAVYRAGKAPSLRAEGFAPYDRRREGVLCSQWDDTTEYIAANCGLDCAVADLPIVSFVPQLPDWARRAAAAKGDSLASQNNAASSMRFIVGAVAAHTKGAKRLHGPEAVRASLPTAWLPGFDAIAAKSWKRARYLVSAAKAAAVNGVLTPQAAPTDAATWRAWAAEGEFGVTTAKRWVEVINHATTLLGADTDWPTIRDGEAPEKRSTRQIPGLREKLVRAGETRDPRTLTQSQIIMALFPMIGAALDGALAHRKGRVRGNGEKKYVEAAGRLCFFLDQFNAPSTIELPEVWVETVELHDGVSAGRSIKGSKYSACPTTAVSYMRAFLNRSGTVSSKNTPLYLGTNTGEALPFFTDSMKVDLDLFIELTRIGYAETLGTSADPALKSLWIGVLAEQDALEKLVKAHNSGKAPMGRLDPEKLLELITLPQMLLMGCAELRRLALVHRARWIAAGRPLAGNAWRTYRSACWDYALSVIILCDGLRVKNYTGALVNRHILPTWKNGRVVGIRTRFWGQTDEVRCTLKKLWSDSTKSKENERENDIYPAMVDPDLMTDFFTVVRGSRLVEARVIGSIDDLTPTSDRYALFPCTNTDESRDRVGDVHPKTGEPYSPQQIAGALTGRYKEPSTISGDIGRCVHWMVVEVMKRQGVPTWGDKEIARLFRGLFKGHRPVRAGNASFWGFEADDWGYAQFITNDGLGTLQRHYSRKLNPSGIERLEKRTGLDKVGHFVGAMKHIRVGGLIDWDRFDPERPDRALIPLGDAPRRRGGKAG